MTKRKYAPRPKLPDPVFPPMAVRDYSEIARECCGEFVEKLWDCAKKDATNRTDGEQPWYPAPEWWRLEDIRRYKYSPAAGLVEAVTGLSRDLQASMLIKRIESIPEEG